MKLAELAGKSLGLLGLGTDVRALLPHLANLEPPVQLTAYDDSPERLTDEILDQLSRAGCKLRTIDQLATDNPDIVVRSPGYPRYREELDPFRSPERMTTPTAVWLESKGQGHHTVLVTGTKGKSSTSAAINALAADANPLLVGNIGVPVWSVDDGALGEPRLIVCEVSSYQASDTRYAATVGVLTNLDADHLSWHGSMEQYHADKLQAVQYADRILCAANNQPAVDALSALVPDRSTSVSVDAVVDGRGPEVQKFFATLPEHIASNLALAVAAVELVGAERLADHRIVERLSGLQALPGRLRSLGTIGSVTIVDDSLASNPMGAAAALATYTEGHAWLVLGGSDRGVPLDPVVDALTQRAADSVTLIGVPDTGAELCAELAHLPAVAATTQVATVADALAHIDPAVAGVLLFSPAAPTPGHIGTWKDRTAELEAAFRQHPDSVELKPTAT